MDLTYSSQHHDVTIPPLPHDGQNSFDDVDVSEEIRLEGFLNE